MPMSVIQRAEKILLNISSDLKALQQELYPVQDRGIEKTQKVFTQQSHILFRKPLIEGLGLFASIGAASAPYLLGRVNYSWANNALQYLQTKENQTLLQEWINKGTAFSASAFVEPSKVRSDAELQRLNQQQQECSNLQSSLQSMIQTHETALQRLQNIESTAKSAG